MLNGVRYKLTVIRYDPHPDAGKVVPYDKRKGPGGFGYSTEEPVYPDAVSDTVIVVELTEGEYAAVKRACIEAAK